MKSVIVTTSWDDGHVLDERLAALLSTYEISGTFYIAPHNREFGKQSLLSGERVRALSRRFEIGAHTMTHPRLPRVRDEEARKEIIDSKNYLETLLDKPVVSFCYPGGAHTEALKQMVHEAGFRMARTVERGRMDRGVDNFAVPTTIHAYQHWSDIPQHFRSFDSSTMKRIFNWDVAAREVFDRCLTEGGVFHLWGHSWEIDENQDWGRLEMLLAHIARRENVTYLTNGELV